MGGAAADDAGFAAVGVDDVGFYLDQAITKAAVGLEVFDGEDRAAHFVDDFDAVAAGLCPLQKRSFGPESGAGD